MSLLHAFGGIYMALLLAPEHAKASIAVSIAKTACFSRQMALPKRKEAFWNPLSLAPELLSGILTLLSRVNLER
jgi:hypothetical protein